MTKNKNERCFPIGSQPRKSGSIAPPDGGRGGARESWCDGFAANTGFRQKTVRNSPAGAGFWPPSDAQAFDIERFFRLRARPRNDFLPEFPVFGRKIRALPVEERSLLAFLRMDNERPRRRLRANPDHTAARLASPREGTP